MSWWTLLALPAVVSCFSLGRPFYVPDCRLQAGYPSGMRVWIPDAPGIERFTFRGQLNSPILGEETGGLVGTINSPIGDNWLLRVNGLILNPGDVVYFWLVVIKDDKEYSRPNQTWTVPTKDKFVDMESPLPPADSTDPSLKADVPKATTIPETTPLTTTTPKSDNDSKKPTNKLQTTTESTTPASVTESTKTESTIQPTDITKSTEPTTTDDKDTTTNPSESSTVTSDSTTSTSNEPVTEPVTELVTDSETMETTTPTDPTTKPTTDLTTKATKNKSTTKANKPSEKTNSSTSKLPPVEKRSTSTEPPKLDDRIGSVDLLPNENETDSTTPSLDKPVSEFSDEPPEFDQFPPMFPGPYRPLAPSQGPGFEICSNPWNFVEKVGETKTDKLERQVAKMQCQLALFQRKFSQLNNIVENELMDIKKLNYDMVSRMSRLESLLTGGTPWGR